MTPRHAFTVVAPVRDGRVADLRPIIERIASDVRGNPLCPFARMQTVHYARWVFLEAVTPLDGKERLPAELVFTSVYDGSLDAHIDELLRHGHAGFDALYALCEGYPAPGNRTDSARRTYLRDRRVPTAALYGAHDGRELARIRLEHRLWRYLDGIADVRREEWCAEKASTEDIRQQLLRVVGDREEFAEAPRYAADATTWPPRRIAGFVLIAITALAALAILPIVLVLFAVWLVILRYHERRDASAQGRRSPEQLDQLAGRENLFTQSQITVVTWVKPGWFRQLTLRLVLFSANTTSRVLLWPKRDFFGIESIHYAQWIVIDHGRRLLFFSNFDGSWENYIGDFVDKAHAILTSVWSNCIGFPKTSFLFFGGAALEEQFKDLVRDNQLPTHVWYAAYPQLSVPNINDASDINWGLHGARRAPAEWLSLL